MIADRDTNFVYLSDLLKTERRFHGISDKITSILDKHKISYDFLKSTKDIWARDYMPIQKDLDTFVQFRYEPSYLKDDAEFQSDPKIVCATNNIKPVYSTINLDGGNVVKWHDKVIVTSRIFDENSGYNETLLIEDLEELLNAKVILIPVLNPKIDLTGHSDGYVRFLNNETILVNDLKNEDESWKNGFNKMIEQTGLKYIEVPYFEHNAKNYPSSAIGIYLNYLEVGNLIIMPIFELKGNKDQQVHDLFKEIFPERNIETININPVGLEGGLMNCITWNIKV